MAKMKLSFRKDKPKPPVLKKIENKPEALKNIINK